MKKLLGLLLAVPLVGCTSANMYPSIAYVSQSLETASGEFNAGVQRLAEGHAVLLEATKALARVAAPEALDEIAALQARLDEADTRFMEARVSAAESRADDAANDANLEARITTGLAGIPGIGTLLAGLVSSVFGGAGLGRLLSKSGGRLDGVEALMNRMLPSPLAPGNGNGNGGTPA